MVARRNIYKGLYLQRGSGVGAVLSSLFRLLVPWVKKGASALIKSKQVRGLAKSAGKAALQSASKFASDLAKGKPTKRAASLNLREAQRGIQDAISKAVKPPPVKKRKVTGQKAIKVKHKPMSTLIS